MKILYLYTEVMGYQIPVFRALAAEYDADVHVFRWTSKNLTPYRPPQLSRIFYYDRSSFTAFEILKIAKNIQPDLVYVSGWQDRGYLLTAAYFRLMGIPVIVGFDDQWIGSLRQHFASFLGRLGVFNVLFSHAWVAGAFQTEYAARLGFHKSKIIFNLLSCDISLFRGRFKKSVLDEKTDGTHAFLYVGNFRAVKGTDLLVEAFKIYRNEFQGKWRLICVGNGPLDYLLKETDGVFLYPFTDPDQLWHYGAISDVFILPSRHDQWGVVLQEFGVLGMPLIASNTVGSASAFLVHGYNGYSFTNNSARELAQLMHKIAVLPHSERRIMGLRSRRLGLKITPELSAASLVSALYR